MHINKLLSIIFQEQLYKKNSCAIRGRLSNKLRKIVCFSSIVAKNNDPLMRKFSNKLKNKSKHTMVSIDTILSFIESWLSL